MDEIVWDDEPQLQAPLIEDQGITWDDAEAPIIEPAPIETPLEVTPAEIIEPVETIQPSIQADVQPEEESLFDQFKSFISQGDASREKAQSMTRQEKDEYIKSSLEKTSSLYQTGQEIAKSKGDISTAIDVKSKLDNIEARTSDISKTLKSFVGDEKSITELKTKQNDLNNEVVSILDGKGIEAFNDNGKLMIVTTDEKGNEVLKSLDEETFSQIMSDLGSAGGEIGGAITGAITGAGITSKKLPLSTSLAKRGVATATSGLIGGYLGAASGRMTDVIRNSLALNREIDAKAMLEKGLESGALDVYAGGAGAVAGKIAGKVGDALTGIKRFIVDGNISGAKKILKSDYNLSDKQIDTMFTNLSKDLEGLDDLQGDKLLRAKLTSAMQQTPQGKTMIAKAVESNPKAAIQLSKEIDTRAKFVEKAADSLTQKPSAIKKSLFAYQKLVKRNYGEVRKLISKALPTEKYQLDKDSFKATLSDINTRVIDPLVKDKLDNLITVLGQKTEGSIDGLIDLRQLFNKFYSKNKSAFELAPDKKALMEIQKTLDTKIDEVIDTLPSDVATGLKSAFKDAKSKYKEMYSVEDNVAFKQIMKKGASDEDIAKSLIKFSKSSDQTLEQVFSKLNPRKRRSAEFSILKEMVKKSNIKGETKAIDFNKLLTNIGTSKQSFKTPEAQQFIKNIESYEAKFGKDAELQRIASGITSKVEKSIATTLTGKIMMKISSMRFEALQRLLPTDNAKRLALQEAISKSLETARTPKELLFKMSKDTSVPSKERQLLKESIKRISEIESKIQKDLNNSSKTIKGATSQVAPATLGATLGFKENEDGTFSYDVKTGLLGAVGATVAKKALTNKQLQQFAKESLAELPDATNRAVKKLTGVQIEPSITDVKKVKVEPKTLKDIKKTKVVDDKGKPLTVYHGTDKEFKDFDKTKSYDGGLWFTSDLDALKKGEVGAGGKGRIIEANLNVKKMAGWDEYDKYSLGELIDQGYDGVKLDDDYIVFENSQIKQISKEAKKKWAKRKNTNILAKKGIIENKNILNKDK